MIKIKKFQLSYTESPSTNIRINFSDGAEFYTSTRLQGWDKYNIVRDIFLRLCPSGKTPNSIDIDEFMQDKTIFDSEYDKLMS